MLADNILLLKKQYPEQYQTIKSWEERNEKPLFHVEKSKDGDETLKYHANNKIVYIHSKYNPIREAEVIINQMIEKENINNNTHMMFYGVGLGYHIDYFTKMFPNVDFSIVEPSIEILSIYLEKKKLKELPLKKLVAIQCDNNAFNFFNKMNQFKDKHLTICELPAYSRVFEKEYSEFFNDLKKIIKEQRNSLNVNYAFKKRWVINSVNNLKVVLTTPNIMMSNNKLFKDKTAVLVSAGPSLDFEIENLRRIKKEDRAIIFSVGSAINTLIHHGIYPHAMCTYDPSTENRIVFKKINDLDISTIPMIFGSSVGFETLQDYKGPKYHMITSQDTIAAYLLRTKNGKVLDKVNDAPSIAVVTLELLAKLEFKQIVLVGQNLAYLNNKDYAEGINYSDNDCDDNCIIVKDVSGNDVETIDSYINMKNMLEWTIKHYNVTVFNTTVGGANIEGAPFRKMLELFDDILIEKSVENDMFERITKNDIYEEKYLLEQLKKLKNEFEVYKKTIDQARKYLNKLKEAVNKNKPEQIKKFHVELDRQIQIFESNLFFTVVALPLNRVEYGLLVNMANTAKKEKNDVLKAKIILEPTETFLVLLYYDLELDEQIMTVLKNSLKSFIGEKYE